MVEDPSDSGPADHGASERDPAADPADDAVTDHRPDRDAEAAASTPAPAGWRELESVPAVSERYGGRSPTAFEREGRELLVQVTPSEPNPSHGEERWRVSLVEGTPTDRGEVRPVRRDLESEAAAREAAGDLMERYNEEFATDEPAFDRLAGRLEDDRR